MASRLELHNRLVSILGSNNAYYQPPQTVKLNYPCFIYELNKIGIRKASNSIYSKLKSYTITYVTKNPDDPVQDTILDSFTYASFDRQYKSDGLNHFVYIVYY